MYEKVSSNKKTYGLADGAKNAKTVKEVGGTSQASASGKARVTWRLLFF